MSTRLQIVIQEDELEELKSAARAERMTLSEWVRQALRSARERPVSGLSATDLEAVLAEGARHRFPAPGIARRNAEIHEGYPDR